MMVMDDGSILQDHHVVIPIDEISPKVVPLLVMIPQPLVPVLLYFERHIHFPSRDYFRHLISFLEFHMLEIHHLLENSDCLLLVMDEVQEVRDHPMQILCIFLLDQSVPVQIKE